MAFPANWRDLSYLKAGTESQRRAWSTLRRLGLPERLERFDPVLTGTFPLALDIPGSDLDLICEVHNLDGFKSEVERLFSGMADFEYHISLHQSLPSAVCNFVAGDGDGLPVQLFGQACPTERQNAYRHMVMEARLLELGGPAAAEAIRAMKLAGVKTEPAFAAYFGLSGNPYQALLDLEGLSDSELKHRLTRRA